MIYVSAKSDGLPGEGADVVDACTPKAVIGIPLAVRCAVDGYEVEIVVAIIITHINVKLRG